MKNGLTFSFHIFIRARHLLYNLAHKFAQYLWLFLLKPYPRDFRLAVGYAKDKGELLRRMMDNPPGTLFTDARALDVDNMSAMMLAWAKASLKIVVCGRIDAFMAARLTGRRSRRDSVTKKKGAARVL